ncbi:hypothetical protein LTR22_027305 [Elasticomyces elasticus]|nr:hypothetical protein LTR22_027305 [Elasticomyces elasticus]
MVQEGRPVIFRLGRVTISQYEIEFIAAHDYLDSFPEREQQALGKNANGLLIQVRLDEYKTRAIPSLAQWLFWLRVKLGVGMQHELDLSTAEQIEDIIPSTAETGRYRSKFDPRAFLNRSASSCPMRLTQ